MEKCTSISGLDARTGGMRSATPAAFRVRRAGGLMRPAPSRSPLLVAGILLGIGLGGFVDGIVLHQILQWHHMVSEPFPPNSVENLQLNTLGDGLFHAFTWLMTLIGLALLWRANRRPAVTQSGRALVGSLAVGWGLFNLIEGIVDHHILAIHHVRSGPDQLAWDVAFLAFGVVLIGAGWALTRTASSDGPVARSNRVARS
jgi:uncharacterized membrane protein